jgi:hypothetical protein
MAISTYLADYLNNLSGVEKDEVRTALTVLQTQPANLFNKDTVTVGSFMGDNGMPVVNATYDYSDFIAVIPGQKLIASHGMRFTAFYNASKTWVAGGSNAATALITVPTGVYFIRITVTHTTLDAFNLSVSSPSTVSDWDGKTWATQGDSITAGGTWQAAAAAKLGLTATGFGVGGTRISGPNGDANAMCQDARINAIATTFDLITMMGGTNDWAQNVALGDPASEVARFV